MTPELELFLILASVEPSGWMYSHGANTPSLSVQRISYPTTYTETPLYTGPQVLAMMAQVVGACVKACEAERLPDQRGGIRMAYDAAIEHCVAAIRATLPTAPIGDA